MGEGGVPGMELHDDGALQEERHEYRLQAPAGPIEKGGALARRTTKPAPTYLPPPEVIALPTLTFWSVWLNRELAAKH